VKWMPMLNWLHWVVILVLAMLASGFSAVSGGWDWRKAQFGGDW
jgi:hypothetical protein